MKIKVIAERHLTLNKNFCSFMAIFNCMIFFRGASLVVLKFSCIHKLSGTIHEKERRKVFRFLFNLSRFYSRNFTYKRKGTSLQRFELLYSARIRKSNPKNNKT